MTWKQRIVVLRFWLGEHPGPLGLAVTLLGIAAILGVLYAVQPRPTGPATEIGGRILSDVPATDAQYYNVTRLVVELSNGVRFTTRPPVAQTCHVGDRAVVARRKAGFGWDHRLLSCHKG